MPSWWLQGDYDSARYQYGGQIFVHSPSYITSRALIKLDNAEITQMGQAFHLGRYSIHWHMQGDVAFQSWVRGCAIHHTYNRAATLHGIHRAVLQNNVAYNTMGHTFFMEVGAGGDQAGQGSNTRWGGVCLCRAAMP